LRRFVRRSLFVEIGFEVRRHRWGCTPVIQGRKEGKKLKDERKHDVGQKESEAEKREIPSYLYEILIAWGHPPDLNTLIDSSTVGARDRSREQ
jgi:hypothetical protein